MAERSERHPGRDIRLLAIDLDGTLIDQGGHRLSEANANALLRAQQSGVNIAPASGRAPFGIEHLFPGASFYNLMIAYGGAWVCDKISGEVLYNQPVTSAAAAEAIRLTHAYDLYISCYVGDTFYVHQPSYEADFEARALGRSPVVKPDLTTLAEQGIHKLLTLNFDDPERLSSFYQAALRLGPDVHAVYTSPYSVELNHPQVSKGAALRYLMERLGLATHQVMAIGDGYNDLSMFACAGISVAMADSPEKVKQAATWVAPKVDEDGAAAAIQRFIL